MRKLIGIAAIVMMISGLAVAGEAPKPEIYGGYQFTSTDGGWHGQGFNGGGNFYITRWLAGTADFGGGFVPQIADQQISQDHHVPVGSPGFFGRFGGWNSLATREFHQQRLKGYMKIIF